MSTLDQINSELDQMIPTLGSFQSLRTAFRELAKVVVDAQAELSDWRHGRVYTRIKLGDGLDRALAAMSAQSSEPEEYPLDGLIKLDHLLKETGDA